MHPILSLAVVAALAVPVAGCTGSPRGVAAASSPSPSPAGATSSAPSAAPAAPGSDADLPLPAAPSVPAVDNVPAARVPALRRELLSVWGVDLRSDAELLGGSGTDTDSGVQFTVLGRTSADGLVRGYACTAAPLEGSFAPPAALSGDSEPAPETMAALETALGFLQTCADSSAADPDRATVWVRAVAQQVLAGTPAGRRIDGVRFRLERSGGGLRLAVGSV